LCCPVLLSRPSPPLRAVPEARPGPLGDTRRLDRSRRSMQPTRPASSLPPIGLWCKRKDVARALPRTSACRLVAWSQPHRLRPRPLSRLSTDRLEILFVMYMYPNEGGPLLFSSHGIGGSVHTPHGDFVKKATQRFHEWQQREWIESSHAASLSIQRTDHGAALAYMLSPRRCRIASVGRCDRTEMLRLRGLECCSQSVDF